MKLIIIINTDNEWEHWYQKPKKKKDVTIDLL